MATYELKPLSVGDILDTAFTVYRRNFGTLMTIAVIALGIPVLLSIALSATGGALLHFGLFLALMVISGAAAVLDSGAVVRAISQAYLGHAATVGDAFGAAFSEFWTIAGAGYLRYLLIGLAGMLLFVPGIIVACGYAVVIPVVMLDDVRGPWRAFGVLGRSWRLTQGFKGRAFVLGFVMMVLIGVPSTGVMVLSVLVPSLAPMFMGIATLVQLALAPAFACVFTVFYYDLRVRKEAFDLDRLAADLGMAPGAAGA